MDTKAYSTSLDNTAKGITLVASLLLAGLAGRSAAELGRSGDDWQTLALHGGMILFFGAVILVSLAFSPRQYLVTGEALVIRRLAKNKVIPLSDIVEVREVEEEDLRFTIRTFGVGGLFGFYGKYHSESLGSFTQYATRLSHRVLVRTRAGKKYVLTPDDLNLVPALRSRMTKLF
jgi:hypothetical protein